MFLSLRIVCKSIFCSVVLLCLGAFALPTAAATRSVDNTIDDATLNACTAAANDCSLRGAIDGAADGDTIIFASPLFDSAQTITLASSALTINRNLVIIGRGARRLIVRRDGSNTSLFGIFSITGGTVIISGLTVSGGSFTGISNSGGTVTLDELNISGNSIEGRGGGGGIYNAGGATMTILNSLIKDNNAAGFGAGIYNAGTLNVANTTVFNNLVSGGRSGGAGIDNRSGTLNLNNVTVSNNYNRSTSTNTTGGVFNSGGAVNARNTIIGANRTDNSPNQDIDGTFISNGNNLIGDLTGGTGFTQPTDKTGAAQLGSLQNNGGQTDTGVPSRNSPAVNSGDNCVVDQTCAANNPPAPLTTDQRGATFLRQSGTAVDIGATELQLPTAAETIVSGRATEASGRGIFRVLVTMTDSLGNQRQAFTNQQGYFRFEDVPSGQVYLFTAQHRRYQFDQPTQAQFVGEEESGINFVGTTNGIFRFDIWNLPTKRIE